MAGLSDYHHCRWKGDQKTLEETLRKLYNRVPFKLADESIKCYWPIQHLIVEVNSDKSASRQMHHGIIGFQTISANRLEYLYLRNWLIHQMHCKVSPFDSNLNPFYILIWKGTKESLIDVLIHASKGECISLKIDKFSVILNHGQRKLASFGDTDNPPSKIRFRQAISWLHEQLEILG